MSDDWGVLFSRQPHNITFQCIFGGAENARVAVNATYNAASQRILCRVPKIPRQVTVCHRNATFDNTTSVANTTSVNNTSANTTSSNTTSGMTNSSVAPTYITTCINTTQGVLLNVTAGVRVAYQVDGGKPAPLCSSCCRPPVTASVLALLLLGMWVGLPVEPLYVTFVSRKQLPVSCVSTPPLPSLCAKPAGCVHT